MNILIRKLEMMKINSLNNIIKQAEENKKASIKKKANRGEFVNPSYFANISRMAFKKAKQKKNKNGNIIMSEAGPNDPGKNKPR